MPTLPMPKAGPDIEKHGADCKIWSHLQHINITVLSYDFKEHKCHDNFSVRPKPMHSFLHGRIDVEIFFFKAIEAHSSDVCKKDAIWYAIQQFLQDVLFPVRLRISLLWWN